MTMRRRLPEGGADAREVGAATVVGNCVAGAAAAAAAAAAAEVADDDDDSSAIAC
jgi:hypothetical protein